jgi:hypothetical protein
MFDLEPVLGRLFVQEAGHVVDFPLGAMALDLPIALRNLLGLKITCVSVIRPSGTPDGGGASCTGR